MVDGTGMCGGCRVTVGGETKFTCVDGPEFDARKVDFVQLITGLQYRGAKIAKAVEKYEEEVQVRTALRWRGWKNAKNYTEKNREKQKRKNPMQSSLQRSAERTSMK
jgi:hypothetical protein